MANNQITPFQLTDQFTMDNFNQRINETNTALQNKTPILQEIPVIILNPEDMTDVKGGQIRLSKIGNMVSFNMNIRPENDQVESEKIYAVLPEGYRPISGATFPACNSLGTSLYGEITTSGNIRFYSSGTTSFISANLMFFSV